MSADDKKYWKSLEEAAQCASHEERAETEFADTPLQEMFAPGRREFLSAVGFAFAGSALTGCSRAPVETAIPLLRQPEGITPGRPYYYAAICTGCNASCGLLAKCRDGWPSAATAGPSSWKAIRTIRFPRERFARLVKPRSWGCTTASGCNNLSRGGGSPLGGRWMRRSPAP